MSGAQPGTSVREKGEEGLGESTGTSECLVTVLAINLGPAQNPKPQSRKKGLSTQVLLLAHGQV